MVELGCAAVLELVDRLDLESSGLKPVGVRLSFAAPPYKFPLCLFGHCRGVA